MQIITVAPIVRGALQGALTYFSKEPIETGMAVVVPIRKREVPAIVLLSRNASDSKSALRSSDYAIRKITRTKPRRIWSQAFLKAVGETANFSAQKFGETLLALTPKAILDAHIESRLSEPKILKTEGYFKINAIQDNSQVRSEAYQRLVRESFVRHESVFICVPTEEDVLRVAGEIGRGLSEYTFAFHSNVTKKRILERWTNATEEKHAILVVGTAQYLGLPRNFKTIVLDEEHSHAWKMFMRPHIDLRVFVEKYARECGSTLVIGAPILRAETHARIADGTIGEFGRIALHAREEIKTILVDPRQEERSLKEAMGKRTMVLLGKELIELVNNALTRNEHVFLLAARKGLAPITTCGDCGTLVRCPECDTPLVIHKKESVRGHVGADTAEHDFAKSQLFVCHSCGFMRVPEDNVHETCPACGGWKLQGVGIGIDRIDDEIKALFPRAPRFVLDGNKAKTRTQAKKIIDQWEKTAGGILIATPMALPLIQTVKNTAIVSIDSLFAIPDIRMSERIFALLLALREKTTGTLLVQTRADDTKIFWQALEGDLMQFTENELSIRKTFSYPPYGTIIKITLRGKRTDIKDEMDRLKAFLESYAPIVSGAMAREPKNIFRMYMILKLAEDNWPNNDLLAKLNVLPSQFTVEVNPDNLI